MNTLPIIFAYFAMLITFAYALKTDIKRREIPNFLSLILMAAGLIIAIAGADTVLHLISGLIFGGIFFVLGYISYQFKLVGGGDVKLWSAAAFAFGIQAIPFVVMMAAFGVVLAIAVYVLQKRAAKLGLKPIMSDDEPMPSNLLHNLGCPEMPYGVAIALSGIVLTLTNLTAIAQGVL